MDPSNVQTSHPRSIRSGVQDDTVTSGGCDIACLPPGSTPDGFTVQTANTGRVARRTKDGSCGVKDRDLHNVICGWAEREGRESNEFRVLFIKEKISNEVFKVQLANMRPECLE